MFKVYKIFFHNSSDIHLNVYGMINMILGCYSSCFYKSIVQIFCTMETCLGANVEWKTTALHNIIPVIGKPVDICNIVKEMI